MPIKPFSTTHLSGGKWKSILTSKIAEFTGIVEDDTQWGVFYTDEFWDNVYKSREADDIVGLITFSF